MNQQIFDLPFYHFLPKKLHQNGGAQSSYFIENIDCIEGQQFQRNPSDGC
jgi:hypothetical protein